MGPWKDRNSLFESSKQGRIKSIADHTGQRTGIIGVGTSKAAVSFYTSELLVRCSKSGEQTSTTQPPEPSSHGALGALDLIKLLEKFPTEIECRVKELERILLMMSSRDYIYRVQDKEKGNRNSMFFPYW